MRVLQVGLGSMGKRRIRNLQYLGYQDILGFDPREDRRQEAATRYNISTVDNYQNIEWDDITHVVVSTPPDKHMQYAIDAVRYDKHVFIEASVVDNDMDILHQEAQKRDVIVAPSCTMRFDPIVIKTKEVLDNDQLGKVLFANHHFGQYLPYWHPYENISDFYVSKRETGAAREIVPFDLVYLSWLLGHPKQLAALTSNTATLGIDIDDIYSLLYKTDRGTQVHLTIDVVSKVSYRYTNIVTENGNIELDNVKGTLSIYYADEKKWAHYTRQQFAQTLSTEEMYVTEMSSFLDAAAGKASYPYSLEDDHRILQYLYAAETSAKSGHIHMADSND